MTAKLEVELEFDPARRSEIIQAAQKLWREQSDPDEIWDLDGNKTTIEATQPKDLEEALMLLLETAVMQNDRLDALGVKLLGMTGPGELEEKVN